MRKLPLQAASLIRSPWLDATRALRSLGGFAATQDIGRTLQAMPAFGEQLSAAIRVYVARPRHRLPNGLYDKWLEKKRKAERGDAPSLLLIAYADFTDYEPVICRADNWPLFEPVFERKERLRESPAASSPNSTLHDACAHHYSGQ